MQYCRTLIFLALLFYSIIPLPAQQTSGTSSKESDQPEWTPEPDRKTRFGKDDPMVISDGKKQPKITNFLVYGATIGSPGSANLNLGYYYKDIVIRASGMHWRPHWWGGQVDLGYSFWKTPVIAHSISIVAGAFAVDPYAPQVTHGGQNSYPTALDIPGYQHRNPTFEDTIIRSAVANQNPALETYLEYKSRDNQKVHLSQRYIGLTYDILLGNFFLQVGAGIGQGNYTNPQLLLQMGYLFDTRSSQ
ncbi:hypothetical protein LEP1GSC058_0617 [Leptospira fainei serovar Hurstbridge str. BUT 6]|uniref:Uncharacterized protein n=1 Tax=Leptospira fainei serovar Hurstbridge str. BUT 6 TaxID=1193011 RepID=S3V3R0_9LEPT|nr:hypothetical protein [Leptospira fainei]EPG76018.1 hypothetical protein LEP1GSC058_0617 [Leptospira fainei serovar Hurstbridge str. BUT 6]